MDYLQYQANQIFQDVQKLGFNVHSEPNPIGLSHDEQKTIAYYALQSMPTSNWLEIGSFCGGSACIISKAMIKSGFENKLICIDRSNEFIVQFWYNVKRNETENYVIRVSEDSYKVEDLLKIPKLSFAFIDGWHSFKHALIDFEIVNDKLEENSFVLFHDTDGLTKENFDNYLENCKINYDFWMKEPVPHPDCHGQTYNVTDCCAYILDKYKNYELVEIPQEYKGKNSITVLKKIK